MKRFLLGAISAALLMTGSFAFDVFPKNELNNYVFNKYVNVKGGFLSPSAGSYGDALIYPLFYVGNGWQSQIRVINPFNAATVAKVVFYSAKDSKELKDFNIYLSAHDEWIGKVIEEDGKYYIYSTDGSSPLTNNAQNTYPMADSEHPLKVEIPQNAGYVQVIQMADIVGDDFVPYTFDGEHSKLREIYSILAHKVREVAPDSDFVFSNGVILNQKAYAPYINLMSNTVYPNNIYTDTNTSSIYHLVSPMAFLNVPIGNNYSYPLLSGDVRITNTLNGTDMVYPARAYYYNIYNTTGDDALIYVEGEKANLGDIDIDYNVSGTGEVEYNVKDLIQNYSLMGSFFVQMTYGDTKDISENRLILTIPFKRLIVQEALKSGTDYNAQTYTVVDMNGNPLFYDVTGDETEGVTSYGSVKLLADIYNNDEKYMSASQFSPATTPTIVMSDEVSSTGSDINDQNKLPYYLNQAQQFGFTQGYITLKSLAMKYDTSFVSTLVDPGSASIIPGIVTQMIATDAGDTVVTNWFTPSIVNMNMFFYGALR